MDETEIIDGKIIEMVESEDNVSNTNSVNNSVNTNVKGFLKGYDPRRHIGGPKTKGTVLAQNTRMVLAEAVKNKDYNTEIGILRRLADDALNNHDNNAASLLFLKAYGKDIETIQLGRFEDEEGIYDMSKLTPEEIEIWSRLEAKARKTESEEG
jgi:hypothetical protein